MKFSLQFACFSLLVLAASCSRDVLADEPVVDDAAAGAANPFFAGFNAPIAYGAVEAAHLTEYAEVVLADAEATRQAIREIAQPDFESVIPRFDAMVSELSKAGNNTYMLYWVSPDAGTRDAGLAAYKRIQEWQVDLYSDRDVFEKILAVSGSDGLDDSQRKLVDDLLKSMRHTGVDLEPEELARFKALNKELEDLSTQYSMNMNGDTSLLRIDEAGAKGLPEKLVASRENVYLFRDLVRLSTEAPLSEDAIAKALERPGTPILISKVGMSVSTSNKSDALVAPAV